MKYSGIGIFKGVLVSIIIMLGLTNGVLAASVSGDLQASLAILPGLAETPAKGTFVDIVKALDDVYTEGRITIQLYPFARSVSLKVRKVTGWIPSFPML